MRRSTVALVCFVLLSAVPALSQPVIFDVGTNYLNDTLYVGQPGQIRLNVDAGPHEVMGICWSFEWRTTNGLSVGPMVNGVNFFYSAYSQMTFASLAETNFGNPDTVLAGGNSFGGPWEGSHTFATFKYTPPDTGTIFVDSITTQPANVVAAYDGLGSEFPLDWRPGPIVVAPCTYLVGDLNGTRTITAGDIILLVNYVFKMGTPPSPHVSIGNADCMGAITSADIIYLVNHQGKGGPPPPCPCYNP